LSLALLQISKEFISNTGWGTFLYLVPILEKGLIGLIFNGKSGSGGVANDTNHPDRVLLKPFVRITDGSYHLPLEVSHTVDIIDDGKISNIIEKAVDRDVPPQGILLRGSKTFCSDDPSFFGLNLFEFRVASESRDLQELFTFEKDMDQSKSATDGPAVPEEFVDLMGVGIGGDVEVLRDLPKKKIPHAPPNEIG